MESFSRDRSWRADDLWELPGEIRDCCELIEGRLIVREPAGRRHGRTEATIGRLLGNWAVARNWGEVLLGETGFLTRRNDRTVRGADVAAISHGRAASEPDDAGFSNLVPELVVEVLSPSERAGAIRQKIEEWLTFGVGQVWAVDPMTRTVAVHAADRVLRLGGDDVLDGGDLLPGFSARVSEFFA